MMVEPGEFVDHATVHRCRKITIDKSGAHTAAIEGMRADSGADIELRQSKYLNNIVEQDHRAIILASIETMHMIKKGQLDCPKVKASSAASQFYSLASER